MKKKWIGIITTLLLAGGSWLWAAEEIERNRARAEVNAAMILFERAQKDGFQEYAPQEMWRQRKL